MSNQVRNAFVERERASLYKSLPQERDSSVSWPAQPFSR